MRAKCSHDVNVLLGQIEYMLIKCVWWSFVVLLSCWRNFLYLKFASKCSPLQSSSHTNMRRTYMKSKTFDFNYAYPIRASRLPRNTKLPLWIWSNSKYKYIYAIQKLSASSHSMRCSFGFSTRGNAITAKAGRGSAFPYIESRYCHLSSARRDVHNLYKYREPHCMVLRVSLEAHTIVCSACSVSNYFNQA